MSFLARPIRPLAAIALRRTFVTTRPALTTGYGRDTGATKDATQSVDPIAGGDLPDYSGPSIAEKKKGGAVDANKEASRLSDTRKADKNINRAGTKAVGNDSLNGARPHSNRRYSTTTAWRAPSSVPSEAEVNERIRQQARYKTPGSLTESATERSNISTELPAGAMSGVTGQSGPANGPSRMSSGDLKEAAADLKDSASSLYQKAKKGARSIKDKVSDVMGGDVSIPAMSDLHIGEKLSSASKRVRGKLQDLSQDLGSTPYADTNSDATGLSTDRPAGGSSMGADDGVAAKSSRSGKDLSEMGADPIAEDELPGMRLPGSDEGARARSSAVPGSIFNGPQDMPQGVGRRAKNELGQAMETGTKDS